MLKINLPKRSLQNQRVMPRKPGHVATYLGRRIYFVTSEDQLAEFGGFDFDYVGQGFYYESILYSGVPLIGPAYFVDDAKRAIEAELWTASAVGGVQ